MSGGIGGSSVRGSPSDGQRQELLDAFKVNAAAVQSLSGDFGRVIQAVPERHHKFMQLCQRAKLRVQTQEIQHPYAADTRDTMHKLGLAAMAFLRQSTGISDATYCVFENEILRHGYSNVITAVELWNTGMPAILIDEENGNIVADDAATLLTWGHYFSFPCVLDTMSPAISDQCVAYLAMSADLCGYNLQDNDLLDCEEYRAQAGGVVCAHFQVTFMNFWLRRIGLMYQVAAGGQGGWRLRAGDERAVLRTPQEFEDVDTQDPQVQDSSDSEEMSQDTSNGINENEFGLVLRASAHDRAWMQRLSDANTDLHRDMASASEADLSSQWGHMLQVSTDFLLYFGMPEYTMRALLSQCGPSGHMNVIKLAQLWNEPMFALQVRTVADRPVVYLDSKLSPLTWGDLFTFPRVRETMNHQTAPQRWGMLVFSSQYSGAGVRDRVIFESAAGRASLGPRAFAQIVTTCMLFWLAKVGRIYCHVQDGRFVHDVSDHVIMSRMEGDETNPGFTDMNARSSNMRACVPSDPRFRMKVNIAAADAALALEVAFRPADGTRELGEWIDVRVRYAMKTHGFAGVLFDWARENVGIQQILDQWEQPVPFLEERGNGRRGAVHLTPDYLQGLVVGDILVWPMPMMLNHHADAVTGSRRLVRESYSRYNQRRQAIFMLARAFAVPFLQATADAGQAPTPGLITQREFGTSNLNSNIPLYEGCQKLLMLVVCGRDEHANGD